jgi:HEAT repeat protein
VGAGVRERTGVLLKRLGVADPGAAARTIIVPDALTEVIADTRSPSPLVSSLAMQELGRFGPHERAIDALLDALVAGRNAGDAARELGDIGPAAARAVPALVRRLDDDESASNVIQALARLGVADESVVTPLRRLVAQPEGRRRPEAAAALGELKAPAAAPELIAALGDSRAHARSAAATALGQLAPAAREAIPPLARLVGDRDPEVRIRALGALSRFGAAARSAVAEIQRQLDADEPRVAAAAADALRRIGGTAAEAAVATDAARYAAADRTNYERQRAAGPDAVRRLLRDLPDARRVVLAEAVAQDENLAIAERGVEALLAAGRGSRAVPALARLVAGRDDGEQLFAQVQRGAIGDPGLFTALTARVRADYPALPAAQQDRIRRAFAAAGLAPP